MFVVNEDNSIFCTRGDVVYFSIKAEKDGVDYEFQPGDMIQAKVYSKKNCKNVVLQKNKTLSEATKLVEFALDTAETKFEELISKPKDYWYEVELINEIGVQTIIGYDEDGPKLFRIYPEGDDKNSGSVVKPENLPIIEELTRKIAVLEKQVEILNAKAGL